MLVTVKVEPYLWNRFKQRCGNASGTIRGFIKSYVGGEEGDEEILTRLADAEAKEREAISAADIIRTEINQRMAIRRAEQEAMKKEMEAARLRTEQAQFTRKIIEVNQ